MAFTASLNREVFDTAYQAFFNKKLVSAELANSRFESELSWGQSVKRVILDYGALGVGDVTNGSNLSYSDLGDSSESLTVNNNKHIGFRIFDDQKKQAGPLSPEEMAGKQMAAWMAQMIDAKVLAEVRNASRNLDTGDLTTRVSNGTAITLSTTTIPQMISQGRAKLMSDPANQDLTELMLVVDPYSGSMIEQYVLSKNIDLAGAAFQNGYAGTVGGARVFISENLSGDSDVTLSANPTAAQTITINGFTYTFVAAIGATAGNVLIEAAVDDTRTNLVAAINRGAGAGTKYVAFTGSTLENFKRLGLTATNDNVGDKFTMLSEGSGALVFGGTATFTKNSSIVNAYLGKPKTIDLVIQLENNLETIRDKDDYADYVRMQKVFGVKTFADSKKKFLKVLIAA
jgi:hypothetical protein